MHLAPQVPRKLLNSGPPIKVASNGAKTAVSMPWAQVVSFKGGNTFVQVRPPCRGW